MEEFDANFISIYNSKFDCFDYYAQRLIGIELENEKYPDGGNQWVIYINGKKEDWSSLVEMNRIISKMDDLVWKFEKFSPESRSYDKTAGQSYYSPTPTS